MKLPVPVSRREACLFFFTVEFMSYFIGLLRFAAIYLSKIYRLKSLTKLWLNGLEKNLFQLINETVNGGTQILIKENDFFVAPFFLQRNGRCA